MGDRDSSMAQEVAAGDQRRSGGLRRFVYTMYGVYAAAVLLVATLSLGSLEVESTVRAFLRAQHEWTRAEHAAIYWLDDYSGSGYEWRWDRYLDAMEEPLHFRRARAALQGGIPNWSRAESELRQAGVSARDAGEIVQAYRWLGGLDPFQRILRLRERSDSLMAEIHRLAGAQRVEWENPPIDTTAVRRWVGQMRANQAQLDSVSNDLTATVVQGSQIVRRGVLWFVGGLTFVLLVGGAVLARLGYRAILGREKEVRRSERRYRNLFEHNVAGVFRATLDGRILECNRAFAEIFGYDSPDELNGEETETLYPDPADRDEYIQRLQKTGSLENEELRLERRDGTPIWVLENSVLTRDPASGEAVNEGTVVDITDRKRAESRLEEMAYRDPLTGLGNRRMLEEEASRLFSLADRQDRYAGLAYLDLDRFKEVNDRWGHEIGDEVLRDVASRLRRESRETDLVARIGGDEFVVLMADLNSPEGVLAATRRLTAVFDTAFEFDDEKVQLGVSAGVAVYPEDGRSLENLLRRADRALYRTGEEGGGLARYRPDLDVSLREPSSFDRRLEAAIQDDELVVHYQPIVGVSSGELTGVEALLRWQHPEQGLLPAGEFVPRAERTGKIRSLDNYVIEHAVHQLAEWQEKPHGPDEVAVNLGAASLRAPSLLRRFSAVLDSADVPDLNGLVVEVTEAEAMADPQVTANVLRGLKETDVRVALDDFGTGHSSLAYLDQFPVDRVKMDRRFVSKLGSEQSDTQLVEAMLALADRLGLETVAEGVEEDAQLEWLAQMGCDLAQGFIFGRAEPPDTDVPAPVES